MLVTNIYASKQYLGITMELSLQFLFFYKKIEYN